MDLDFKDTTPMPFGKYTGKPLIDIPANYLFWLETEILKVFHNNRTLNQKLLLKYIHDNRQVLDEASEIDIH